MKLFSVHVNTEFGGMYLKFSKEMEAMTHREQVDILDIGMDEISTYLDDRTSSDRKYIWTDSAGHIAPRVMTEEVALQTTFIHKYEP